MQSCTGHVGVGTRAPDFIAHRAIAASLFWTVDAVRRHAGGCPSVERLLTFGQFAPEPGQLRSIAGKSGSMFDDSGRVFLGSWPMMVALGQFWPKSGRLVRQGRMWPMSDTGRVQGQLGRNRPTLAEPRSILAEMRPTPVEAGRELHCLTVSTNIGSGFLDLDTCSTRCSGPMEKGRRRQLKKQFRGTGL